MFPRVQVHSYFYASKQTVFAPPARGLVSLAVHTPGGAGGMFRIAEAWRILSLRIGLEQSMNIWYLGKNQPLGPPAQS